MINKKKIISLNVDEDLITRADEMAEWKKQNRSQFWEAEMARSFGHEFTRLLPEFGEPPEPRGKK